MLHEGIVANATKLPYVMRTYDTKLAEFLTSLQLERGASPHTIEAYKRDLIDLGDFVEHVDPDQIEVSVLDDYALALQDRGLSPATVRRRLAAVRAFLKYRAREGGRPDAGRSVPLPRLGRRLPEPLTPQEAEAIVTCPTSISRRGWCAAWARAPSSAWCRRAAVRSRRSVSTCTAAGLTWAACSAAISCS
jgi:integrase